jgi:hypothetical protein
VTIVEVSVGVSPGSIPGHSSNWLCVKSLWLLFIAHDVKGGGNCGYYVIVKELIRYFKEHPDKAKELEEYGIDVLDLEATWDGVFKFRLSVHEFAEANASIIVLPEIPLI